MKIREGRVRKERGEQGGLRSVPRTLRGKLKEMLLDEREERDHN